MKRFFITGTNTDVGKTFVSSLLFNNLENPCYYKPIQTGYDDINPFIPDMDFIKTNSKISNNDNFKCSYKLKYPLSPHLSSRKTNIEVSIDKILHDYSNICKRFKNIIVEGAGGVIVPINDKNEYLYTLIKVLNIPCILVTTTKIGTINNTLLTLEFLKSKNIPVHGIVFNMFNGEEYEIDNINFIKNYSGIENTLNVPENTNTKTMDKNMIKTFIYKI